MTFSSSLCRCYVDRFRGGYEGGKEIQIQCRSREGQRHIGKCEQTEPVVGETANCISFVKSWKRSDKNWTHKYSQMMNLA